MDEPQLIGSAVGLRPPVATKFASVVRKSKYNYAFINYASRVIGVPREAISDIIVKGVSADQTDEEIMREVVSKRDATEKSKNNNSTRASGRTTIIKQLTGDLPITSFIDYGCGDASITAEIAEEFKIGPENAIAVDTFDELKTPAASMVSYVRSDCTAAIPSESADLVTAFMSLHHCANVGKSLCEIRRMLKLGGMLILREHNFVGGNMLDFLHLVHVFNDVADYGACDCAKLIKETRYRSRPAWRKLIESHGFRYVDEALYSGNNPQGTYHESYRKI